MVTQIHFSSHWTTMTTSSVVQYKGQGNVCQQTQHPPPHWNSTIFPKSSPEGCKQERIVVQIEARIYKSSSQETVQENSMPCFRSLPFLHMYKKDLINPLKVLFHNFFALVAYLSPSALSQKLSLVRKTLQVLCSSNAAIASWWSGWRTSRRWKPWRISGDLRIAWKSFLFRESSNIMPWTKGLDCFLRSKLEEEYGTLRDWIAKHQNKKTSKVVIVPTGKEELTEKSDDRQMAAGNRLGNSKGNANTKAALQRLIQPVVPFLRAMPMSIPKLTGIMCLWISHRYWFS